MSKISRTAPLLALLPVLVAVCFAGSQPAFWSVSTLTGFLAGEADALSIDEDGALVLGPESSTVFEATVPFLWQLASTDDGQLIAGSGNDGQVFRVDPSGSSAVLFDASELEVHAVAVTPDGTILAGSSPNGKVYAVRPDGSSSVLFDPDSRYIWSLLPDGSGAVYVGTGDKGLIYRIGPDGEAALFYDTKTAHVVSLAWDRSGRLLAGTESPGRVFRITPEGQGFVLLDTSFREIRSLRVDDGGDVYATAIGAAAPGGESAPPPEPTGPEPTTATVSADITITAVGQQVVSDTSTTTTTTPPAAASTGTRGAVYRIGTNDLADRIWESADDAPYDVAWDGSGGLLIATGGKGKIYRVHGDPARTTLLVRAPAEQVTSMVRRDEGLYVTTSNPGKLLRIGTGSAARGEYLSEVRDATNGATWGAIRWRAVTPPGTSVEISTRSGNTQTPDEAWSPWSASYDESTGSQITSPNARYLQWRAVLTGSGTSPTLGSVTAAYLPRNTRPRITAITLHAPGTVFQRPFPSGDPGIAGFEPDAGSARDAAIGGETASGTSPALGRQTYRKGLQTIVWQSEDADADTLDYSVWYRRADQAPWKLLKRGLRDTLFTWDTTSVPDGTYLVKIVASDALSNDPARALSAERESATFDVDNSPPRIEVGEIRREGDRLVVTIDVLDEQSPTARVESSLDASAWRVLYPVDGLADTRRERFEVTVPVTDGGTLFVRATDAMSNVTTAVADLPRNPPPD